VYHRRKRFTTEHQAGLRAQAQGLRLAAEARAAQESGQSRVVATLRHLVWQLCRQCVEHAPVRHGPPRQP
jgi:hypothetical protein